MNPRCHSHRLRARGHHPRVARPARMNPDRAARRRSRSSARESSRRRGAGEGSLVDVSWNGGRHVGVDAEQSLGCLQAHRSTTRTPVAALGDVAGVAEALHQLCPGSARCGSGPQPGSSACPRSRSRASTGAPGGRRPLRSRRARWVGQSDRWSSSCSMTEPGQPWFTIKRQRVFVLRTNVDEVDVEPVDLGGELRERVQLRLDLAPVVVGRPVARELLHRGQLHALRSIRDELLARASASRRCVDGGRRVPRP